MQVSALHPAMDASGALNKLRLLRTPWKALRPFHTAHSLMISSRVLKAWRVQLRRTFYTT